MGPISLGWHNCHPLMFSNHCLLNESLECVNPVFHHNSKDLALSTFVNWLLNLESVAKLCLGISY